MIDCAMPRYYRANLPPPTAERWPLPTCRRGTVNIHGNVYMCMSNRLSEFMSISAEGSAISAGFFICAAPWRLGFIW